MPYSARTCGGGGPGGGPGGFFPGGKRGTPGTVANTGPEDDETGPLLRDTRRENYISTILCSRLYLRFICRKLSSSKPTQRWNSSSVWTEAEPLVMGCPGCGYWRGHEAYLVKGCCQPPLTLHSEKKDTTHIIINIHHNTEY